nr:MAG TPA: hypothetical protein [Caudoviricetes sp.]
MMETTMKKTKTGLITLKTERGWEPWGIGTFREGAEAQAEAGARAFAYCPLTPRREG